MLQGLPRSQNVFSLNASSACPQGGLLLQNEFNHSIIGFSFRIMYLRDCFELSRLFFYAPFCEANATSGSSFKRPNRWPFHSAPLKLYTVAKAMLENFAQTCIKNDLLKFQSHISKQSLKYHALSLAKKRRMTNPPNLMMKLLFDLYH